MNAGLSLAMCAALLAAACQSAPADEVHKAIRVTPAVSDDPANDLIRLTYTNDTGRKVCLDNWPTRGGIFQNNGEQIFLTIGDEKFYLKREQDYCPGGCGGTEVQAGGKIDGVIFYDLFRLPEHLRDAPKVESEITVMAATCPRRRR